MIIWLILLFIVMGLGIWFAPHAPGYMLIRLGDFVLETSVVAFVVIFALTVILVWLAVKLWQAPGNVVRKFLERRAEAQLELGILALSEGNWSKAEKALSRSAKSNKNRSVSYIAAAQAAHSRGSEDRGEAYLEEADRSGRAHDSVMITRAQMALASGDPETALKWLEDVKGNRTKKPRVLDLLARSYERLNRWNDLVSLSPELVKADLIKPERAEAIRVTAINHSLSSAADERTLNRAWKNLSRADQKNTDYLEAYARKAIQLGGVSGLGKLLSAALGREWSDQLCDLYRQLDSDPQKRLLQAESWLPANADSASLHLLVGELCCERQLWAKAEEHLDRSIQLGVSADAYEAKGRLSLAQDDPDNAAKFYRQAIELMREAG